MTRTHSKEELQIFARDFARSIAPQQRATVVTLSGELGAGKTTFTQGVAAALGVSETVSSPTFVLEKVYALSGQKFTHLIHIDAYRIKSAEELRTLGWEEAVREPDHLILVEWPENIPELIPGDAIRIRFDIEGEGRRITINDGKESGEKSS